MNKTKMYYGDNAMKWGNRVSFKEKALYKNYFKIRSNEWTLQDMCDYVYGIIQSKSIPIAVCSDSFDESSLFSHKETPCIVFFNPDRPKMCARYAIIQHSNDYYTVFEAWKLYHTKDTIPPITQKREIDLHTISDYMLGANDSDRAWMSIIEQCMEEVRVRLTRK